ncbi:MAG: hypothetical protein COA67_03930 [Lutibacter sp.]|nr:MAG: hypothetical protein COA67_03930 [Lutibacter sp.]
MKKAFKITNLIILSLLLVTYSCNNDDDVVLINLQDLEVTIDENPTVGQVIGTIQSDSSSSLTYSIESQTPIGALSINTSSGELTVLDAALFDFETNPVITATVSADEAENTVIVTINLTNLEVTIQNFGVDINENPTNGQSIGTVQTNGTGTLNFSIASQTPAGALAIDASTGEITVADATLFDFETNPTITATISDEEATNTATVTINLVNVNEITMQDLTVAIDENPINGQSISTVQTTGGTALNFSIASQTPASALSIDAITGELTVADATLFDFETNPIITATVNVDDAINTAIVTIDLNNVNELSIQDFSTTIDENPTNGDSLGTVQATGDGTLSFSISSQTPAGALSIDASTGELTVLNATSFDFESNPTITANISVDNSVSTEAATATINLNDLAEPATIGDFRDGGVVFWVDPTDNNHGLVVAVNNQSFGAPWGCQGITVSPTYSDIGSGAANTVLIEAICTTPGTAADFAANLSLNGYNDWFLPSRFELNEYYTNKNIVNATVLANGGAIPNQFHWSSTQSSSNLGAFVVNLTTGTSGSAGKNSNYGVRAVRAF